MSRKIIAAVSLLVLASLLMTACQPQTVVQTVVVKETSVVEKSVEKSVEKQVVVTATPAPAAKPKRPNVIHYSFGTGDVPTLDPGVSQDTSSITVIENTFGGLTHLNEVTSALEPGMTTTRCW